MGVAKINRFLEHLPNLAFQFGRLRLATEGFSAASPPGLSRGALRMSRGEAGLESSRFLRYASTTANLC